MRYLNPLPDGNDKELPPHTIESDGALTWSGEPLNAQHLQAIVFALRNASGMGWSEKLEKAKERWLRAYKLAAATLAKLPSSLVLAEAIERMPRAPKPPTKPRKTKFLRVPGDLSSLNDGLYQQALTIWRKGMVRYEGLASIHRENAAAMRQRVENWQKYGGEKGIEKFRNFRARLTELAELLDQRLNDPASLVATLPFELLPPGLWNLERLMLHLGGRQWRVQEIVPQRLEHLFSLKPIRVYEGSIHKNYREYFVFLYDVDGPAILESPFHGNASYVLHRDWLTLCQRTKAELIRHPSVTRVIHHEMESWRWEIQDRLKRSRAI